MFCFGQCIFCPSDSPGIVTTCAQEVSLHRRLIESNDDRPFISMTQEDENKLCQGAPKEKLRSIMEAASALTALGDEESDGSRPNSPKNTSEASTDFKTGAAIETSGEKGKLNRYIPDYKKPNAALTFPEKVGFVALCASSYCRFVADTDKKYHYVEPVPSHTENVVLILCANINNPANWNIFKIKDAHQTSIHFFS